MARAVHRVSPETLIVYRKVWNDWHYYIYDKFGTDMMAAARAFVQWLEPELEEISTEIGGARFAVEGLNEAIATGALEDIRRVAEFEAGVARLLAESQYNCRAVVLNVAVGNPQHGAETELLVPAVRAAVETDGYVGYHAYWPASKTQTWLESDWEHFAGRWAESWDPVFREHGLRPRYVMTEGGAIGDSNVFLNAEAGWRKCIGDWGRTLDEILRYDQLCRGSLPGREGRYVGTCLFTTGGVKWEYFQYYREQFETLGRALAV